MSIRRATRNDAAEACDVIRRSIIELCVADHRSDPEAIAKWLANKTPGTVSSWIDHPNSRVLVATAGDKIIGVGAITRSGEITLNYILPSARFQGVSKALLRHLEAAALEFGQSTCALTTTATASRFYRSAGYTLLDSGPSDRMVKHLKQPTSS